MSHKKSMIGFAVLAVALATVSAQAQFAGTGHHFGERHGGRGSFIQVNTATTTLTNIGTIFASLHRHHQFGPIRCGPPRSADRAPLPCKCPRTSLRQTAPQVATPPTAGDVLAYTCTVSAPATQCSGTVNSSTAAATSVATFGADAHSASAGNAGSVAWSLTDDPTYKTGAYSADRHLHRQRGIKTTTTPPRKHVPPDFHL